MIPTILFFIEDKEKGLLDLVKNDSIKNNRIE